MIVLGIDTSGPVGSVALRRDGRCVEERFLPELGRRHAQTLVPEVVRLLRGRDVDAMCVDAVAVSVGPGSFTGLRVGVTFAKTFAYATGAALTAVETFLAIAENTPAESTVGVVADAQRRGVMLGEYVRSDAGRFRRDGAIRLIAPERVPDVVPPPCLLTGPGLGRLAGIEGWNGKLAPPHLRVPRASIVAELGERQVDRGELADAWTLEPLYVRKSAAEEKRELAQDVR